MELSDRQLAWCVSRPGAVGDYAADKDLLVSEGALAVVDDGIHGDADRWRYYEAWDEVEYASVCSRAYGAMGGADDDVELSILEPEARIAPPTPTANINSADLSARAQAMVPVLEEAGARLVLAYRSMDSAEMSAAANVLQDIATTESDSLFDAVAEPCYVDAGAAYGMTVFNWRAVASNVLRFLNEGDPALIELADDFAHDAATSGSEWRALDRGAC